MAIDKHQARLLLLRLRVKRAEGNGLYSIKMVGSNRGKVRVVGWKNLFREESFNEHVCRTDSGRVS